jgi:pimeloyl-ACP methyl ester carboxylesterase
MPSTTSVLFIHGMYLNAASWQPWVERAAAAGLDAHALSWPFHDGTPAQRRASIDPGVGISSAPAGGVLSLSPHFVPANFPHINPFAGNRPVVMTAQRFRYTFGNTMTPAASDALFEQYVVPESRNVPRSTLTSQAAIDFTRSHVPLQFLTGDDDHLTPLDAVRRNARAYRRGGAGGEVEVQVFAGRCHAICNQDGWHEVADVAFAFVVGG